MKPFRDKPALTPAAIRIVRHCQQLSSGLTSAEAWAGNLVLTLLLDESLASASLRRSGVTLDWLISGGLGTEVAVLAQKLVDSESGGPDAQQDAGSASDGNWSQQVGVSVVAATSFAASGPDEFHRILERASAFSRRDRIDEGISSGHLLAAVIDVSHYVREQLQGLGAGDLLTGERSAGNLNDRLPQLHVDCVLGTERPAEPQEDDSVIWRVIDVNLNRAREGLRVLEDIARFVFSHESLSRQLKQMRHSVVLAEQSLQGGRRSNYADAGDEDSDRRAGGQVCRHPPLLTARNVGDDVGTGITTDTEQIRSSIGQLTAANGRRVQEAMRSLEEFGKLIDPEFSAVMKQIRYQAYDIEQRLMAEETVSAASSHPRWQTRRIRLRQSLLYALITESLLPIPWQEFVRQILAGGVDVIQLREKTLPDRKLIIRGRWLKTVCAEAGALLIINDRPDIAVLVDADGVHVGQEELPAQEVRRLIGPDRLLGVSTHHVDQAVRAVADGADYLGVGPVFPGSTKAFAEFPGLKYVQEVQQLNLPVPWFAIGGIQSNLIPQLNAAGADRIAVTSALSAAAVPELAAAQLRTLLSSVRTS